MTDTGHLENRLIVRQFRIADYDQVRAVWSAAGMSHRDSDALPELQKKLERDPDLFLVADSEGEIVGAVIGAWDGRRGWVYRMAVRPDHQKSGVGRLLLEAVEAGLRSRGALKINLLVEVSNPDAVGFYERIGYSRGDYIVMAKTLGTDNQGMPIRGNSD